MTANLYALNLIALLSASVAVLARWGQPVSIWRWLVGLSFSFACFWILLVFFIPCHACDQGRPLHPLLFACLLAGTAFASIPRRGIKWTSIAIFLALGSFWSHWGHRLAHHPGWVANLSYVEETNDISGRHLDAGRSTLETLARKNPELMLEPGWVEVVCRAAVGEEVFRVPLGHRSASASRAWHTWLTGLHRLEEHPNGVWCPGGPILQCMNGLSLRIRFRF